MRIINSLILGLLICLTAGCIPGSNNLPDSTSTGAAFIASPTLSAPTAAAPMQTTNPSKPTSTSSVTPLPLQTSTPKGIITPTLTAPANPSLTPTINMLEVSAGSKLTVPILLYHHIATHDTDIRYFVTPDDFQAQMEMLNQLGYKTISMSHLIDVIKNGGSLPARPMIISFDDGDEDVYLNAFPIMKKLGMIGVYYMVANRVGLTGFVSTDELKSFMAAGWEIGCHGMTHIDLKKNTNLAYEMYQSRLRLEADLGTRIQTFAYPLGNTDSFIMKKAKTYGYDAAVGLGGNYYQSKDNIYNLGRIEIRHSTTMKMMLDMLPWKTPQ